MSASFYWTPSGKSKHLDVPNKSDFGIAMEDTFGVFPMTLNEGHLPQLQAMAAVIRTAQNPYRELVELIEQHGEIELRREY